MVAKGYQYRTPEEEFAARGVDPRLDNRTGADRPPVETHPAVPQQVDGPDVMHQAEHAEAAERLLEAAVGDRKGMFSPGDHSLGGEDERGGNHAGLGGKQLETDAGRPQSAPTDGGSASGAATPEKSAGSDKPAGSEKGSKSG